MTNTTKKNTNDAADEAMATFLANGGVIQQIGRNVSGHVDGQQSYWGKPSAGRPKANAVPPPNESNDE